MKCVVTGGAGFAGSHALRHFLANTDWTFTVPVSLDHRGHLTRLESACKGFAKKRVQVVSWDMSQPPSTSVKAALGSPDYVIHYASNSDVQQSIDDPVPFVTNNLLLQVNVLEWARTLSNLKVFLNFSTDEVYGPAAPGQSFAEWSPTVPSNPYSASKAAAESLTISWWRTYGLPLIITNCTNLVGEYQDKAKMLPMLVDKISAGEEVTVHADKNGIPGSRSYIHARSAADACLFLIRNRVPQKYDGFDYCVPDRYNIPGDLELDNLELAKLIASHLGKPLKYRLEDAHKDRPGHDWRYALSGDKITRLGWTSPVPLERALKKVISWGQLPSEE